MRLKWRLTTVRQKVLYIALGWGVPTLLLFALRTWFLDPRSWAYATIGLVVTLAYTFIGVRTFRGYLEPHAPPRDWWRWTGRPKAGFWLGALYAIATLDELQNFWPREGVAANYPLAILTTLSSAVVAIGYFNSSFRLRLHPDRWSQRKIKPKSVESAAPYDAA